MNAVVVNRENKKPFQNLMSVEAYESIGESAVLTVGAVNDEGLATGVIVIRLNANKTATLEWIYVAPEKRREGIGTFLYDTIKEQLLLQKYDIFCTVYHDGEDSADMESFFKKQKNMQIELLDTDIRVVKVRELAEKLLDYKVSERKCEPVKDVPLYQIKKFVNSLSQAKKEQAGELYEFDSNYEAYKEASCALVTRGKVRGLFWVRKSDDKNHYVLDFVVNQTRDKYSVIRMMLCSARQIILNNPEAVLDISTLNTFGIIVEKLCPEDTRKVDYKGAYCTLG